MIQTSAWSPSIVCININVQCVIIVSSYIVQCVRKVAVQLGYGT
jgi:hypothetical protein